MANNKKHVLVIEDEVMISKAIAKKLELSGFGVLVASDGEEGLRKALETKPDLVLLDLVLPQMDGVSVLTAIRKDSWGKEVPVIILTNLSKAEVVEESIKKGANDYLVKTDWKIDDVIEKVKYELGIL